MNQLSASHTQSPSPGLEYAVQLLNNGELEQAKGICKDLLTHQPENANARQLLGVIHFQQDELEEAEKQLNQAISINPSEHMYHFSMGNVWLKRGDHERALTYYDRSIELCPNFSHSHNNRGVILQAQGRLVEAIESFSEAVRIDPDHFQAGDNRSLCSIKLVRQRITDPVLSKLEKAEEQKPGQSIIPLPLGASSFLYCPQYRFVYASIPKVACSSFKMLMYKIFKRDVPELPYFPTDRPGRNYHIFMDRTFALWRYSQFKASKIFHSADIVKFAVVRDPFKRIASAYLNLFVTYGLDRFQHAHTLPVLQEVYGRETDPAEKSVTFRLFVRHLLRYGDDVLDKHWRSMHTFVNPADMDMVLRMENIKEDYARLKEMQNLPFDLPGINRSPKKALPGGRGAYADSQPSDLRALPALPSAAQLYDEELVKAVRERYKADFEIFGYSDEFKW